MTMRDAYEDRIKQLETRLRAAETSLDVEKLRTKNLADAVIRLISQREKTKDLFDEAFRILANQPGLLVFRLEAAPAAAPQLLPRFHNKAEYPLPPLKRRFYTFCQGPNMKNPVRSHHFHTYADAQVIHRLSTFLVSCCSAPRCGGKPAISH